MKKWFGKPDQSVTPWKQEEEDEDDEQGQLHPSPYSHRPDPPRPPPPLQAAAAPQQLSMIPGVATGYPVYSHAQDLKARSLGHSTGHNHQLSFEALQAHNEQLEQQMYASQQQPQSNFYKDHGNGPVGGGGVSGAGSYGVHLPSAQSNIRPVLDPHRISMEAAALSPQRVAAHPSALRPGSGARSPAPASPLPFTPSPLQHPTGNPLLPESPTALQHPPPLQQAPEPKASSRSSWGRHPALSPQRRRSSHHQVDSDEPNPVDLVRPPRRWMSQRGSRDVSRPSVVPRSDDNAGGELAQRSDSPDVLVPYPVYHDADLDAAKAAGGVLGVPGKEKDKGRKKLFGGFGAAKTKNKEKERGAATPTGMLSENGTSAIEDSVEDLTALRLAKPDSKEGQPHWYEMKGKGPKTQEPDMTSKIGWLCASAYMPAEWPYLLSLAQELSHSEAESKDAARALRKEFKYGAPEQQIRAAHLLGVLALHASDRFKLQIATKRFLEVVEDTALSSKTSWAVKEAIWQTLSVLAYEFTADKELSSVTKCWNKVKPANAPSEGPAIERAKIFLVPPKEPEPDLSSPLPARNGSHTESPALQRTLVPHTTTPSTVHPVASVSGDNAHADRTLSAQQCASSPAFPTRGNRMSFAPFIPPDEDARKLHEECDLARGNAHVLIETLTADGMDGALVNEFADKVQAALEFLGPQVPWATAQADRSRHHAGPTAPETREEALLADILDANERLVESANMLAEAQRTRKEDEEEREVTERSKHETRVDRSAMAQDPVTGALYSVEAARGRGLLAPDDNARASGSRSPSPSSGVMTMPHGAPPLVPTQLQAHLVTALNSVSSTTTSPTRNPFLPDPAAGIPSHSSAHRGGPRPLPGTLNPVSTAVGSPANHPPGIDKIATSHADLGLSNEPRPHEGTIVVSPQGGAIPVSGDDDDDEVVTTPVFPSAKALGKRRAVSDRGDAFDPALVNAALHDVPPALELPVAELGSVTQNTTVTAYATPPGPPPPPLPPVPMDFYGAGAEPYPPPPPPPRVSTNGHVAAYTLEEAFNRKGDDYANPLHSSNPYAKHLYDANT